MGFYVLGEPKPPVHRQLAAALTDGVASQPVIRTNLLWIAISKALPEFLAERLLEWQRSTGRIRSVLREINDGTASEFASELAAASAKPTFHVLHIAGAHRPYLQELDGRLVNAPNTYANYKANARNGLQALRTMLSALRARGIYDNTAMIVVGDHGVPDTGRAGLSGSHLMPLFMMKPMHRRDGFQHSGEAVSLADLRPLLGAAFDADGLTQRDAAAVLAKPGPRRVATFESHIFNPLFNSQSLPLREYAVHGPAADPESWQFTRQYQAKGFAPRRSEDPRTGTRYPAEEFGRKQGGGVRLEGSWGLQEPGGTWTLSDGASIVIPGKNLPPGPLVLHLEREVNADAEHPVGIAYRSGKRLLRSVLYSSADQPGGESLPIAADDRDAEGNFRIGLAVERSRPGRVPPRLGTVRDDLGLFLSAITIEQAQAIKIGQTLGFGEGQTALSHRTGEWHPPQPNGSWIGARAGARLPLADPPNRPVSLDILASAYDGRGETTVSILLNGRRVVTRRLGSGEKLPERLSVPAEFLDGAKSLDIGVECSTTAPAPQRSGRPAMARCLFLRSLSLNGGEAYGGQELAFGRAGSGLAYQTGGWGRAEAQGTWSARSFGLRLPLAEAPRDASVLTFDGAIEVPAGRSFAKVDVSLNGAPLASWRLAQGAALPPLPIWPASLSEARELEFAFACRPPSERCLFLRSAALGRLPPVAMDVPLTFGANGGGNAYLLAGWGAPEAAGIWSGPTAALRLPLDATPKGPLLLRLEGEGRAPAVAIDVHVNGARLTRWRLSGNRRQPEPLLIPAHLAAGGDRLDIELSCAEPEPAGQCFFLQGLEIEDAPAPLPAGTVFSASAEVSAQPFLRGEWYAPDRHGVWSGDVAGLHLPLPQASAGQAWFLSLSGSLAEGRGDAEVSMSANGRALRQSRVPGGGALGSLFLPADLTAGQDSLDIGFRCAFKQMAENRCLFLQSFELVPAGLALDNSVAFQAGGIGQALLVAGWKAAEAAGTWSGSEAELALPPIAAPVPLALELDAEAMLKQGKQVVQLALNGTELVSWTLHPAGRRVPRTYVPQEWIRSEGNELRLNCPEPGTGVENCLFLLALRFVETPAYGQAGGLIEFAAGKVGTAYLHGSWSAPESQGSWSGNEASIVLPVTSAPQGFWATVDAEPGAQPVRVAVNGRHLAEWNRNEASSKVLRIPPELLSGRQDLRFSFECVDVVPEPAPDPKRCLFVRSLRLEPLR